MNLILAVVVLAVVLYQGAEVAAHLDQPPIVGRVVAGSPAERAGFLAGDRITSVSGSRTNTWQDVEIAVGTRANRETTVGYVRDGVEATKTVTPRPIPNSRFEIGEIGVLPDVHPRVWPAVNKDGPGDRAGIKVGDVIVSVNGQTVTYPEDLIDFISKSADQPVSMVVQRGEDRLDIHVTPERRGDKGALGVYLRPATRVVRPGAFEALTMSVRENVAGAGLIFRTVWGLLTRETSPKQLLGPVGIAQLSGEFARIGWIALLGLMANLSLNLGLVNLLPIPVLDGGHIFIMMIEGIARRDFSMRVKEKMLLAGFVVLMMLMVTVIYNDLTRISWIERLMPWRN
jgi:regulator of sigma E protease